MFQTKIVEQIKTYILCSIFFFENPAIFWDNVEKYCTAGQVTSEGHAHCMLDKHTLGICNTHCFSTTTKKYCIAGQATNYGHAHCMLDKHTLRICNSHCFSTTTKKYCIAGQATNYGHAHCMLGKHTHSEYVIVIAFPLQQKNTVEPDR